eukprot:3790792-Karenia_brevis.AAC.1
MGIKTVDVEEDEPEAERLTEVTGISELQEDYLTTSIDENGTVKIKKGSKETSLPRTPELLRAKLRLMGNAWVFLRLRYAKAWLSDMNPDVFR